MLFRSVPFVIYKSGVEPDGVARYSESDVAGGAYGVLVGEQFIKEFFRKN